MKKSCGTKDLTSCIQAKAKELWEKDGCQPGRDLEYWLKAEKIIKGKAKK